MIWALRDRGPTLASEGSFSNLIVDTQKERIWPVSEDGEGSTFGFALPTEGS